MDKGWEIEDGGNIVHLPRGQKNEFWKWQVEKVKSTLEETILLKGCCFITR